ncbi:MULTISPECIES: hypothetical protein [Haemophilus]|uniref:Uncharacterized protein n=1 Tax=Haemophilus aegyptius TaxID=197575 RepID=A0ABY1VUI0_HAEAE|nr:MULTISPECIES: hypothetical protein [Haemophilus]EGF19324.1 hypothetical protein HMPREF9095_0045 [Haemophilus aegyptius ATCC 11116]OBX84687.1 hypothetical protein A9520_07945 [Haemophilus aegyptius]TMQ41277.1 hypothetical protein AO054_09750 [Haemophilus influenzae biotype aegyptius]UAK83104.1 hypothetical protein K8O83_02860 [Haemophilus aegyptius]SQH36330.1 Uncharacterised protein [Haemophilus aegyptius]
MNINSSAELKAFFITEVLERYAEKTGKALEALADLFMTNEDFRNLIMDEVEVEAKQVVAHI